MIYLIFLTVVLFLLGKLVHEYFIKPKLLLSFYNYQKILTFSSPSYQKLCDYNLKFYGDSLYHQKSMLHTSDACKAYAIQYGKSVMLTIVDPKLKKDFFLNQLDNYQKYQPHFRVVQPIIGHDNLLLKESKMWKESRKLLAKAFQFDFIKNMTPLILKTAADYFQSHQTIEEHLIRYFEKLTLRVAICVVLGEDALEIKYEGYQIDDFIYSLVEETIRLHKPKPFGKKETIDSFKQKVAKFDSFLSEALSKEFNSLKEKGPDSLKKQTFLYALSQESVELSSILFELVTVIVAATDTTGHFLSHVCICLKKNKDIHDKLLQEIKENIKNDSDITFENIMKLKYLDGVIQEILRIYSPIPDLFPRIATKTHNLGDIQVKKGTIVNISLMTSNNDEKVFQDSHKIIPERWIKTEKENNNNSVEKNPYSHLPFSFGERNCIGQHLALLEIKVVLVKFLLQKKFEIVSDEKNIKWIRRFLYEPYEPVFAKISNL